MHLFYQPQLDNNIYLLENEEFHHCINVLKHSTGSQILISNGKGSMAKCLITKIHKNYLEFEIADIQKIDKKKFHTHLAFAPLKQMERMEWMTEKLCELDVDRISFIFTQNCERNKINIERLEKKTVAALKQSKSAYKTEIQLFNSLEAFLKFNNSKLNFVATLNVFKKHLNDVLTTDTSICMFIGPEGDFTKNEVQLLNNHNFETVSLGQKTLRSETAAIYSCSVINFLNRY